MREAVEEFDDSTTLVFYLYKGQYAAIDIIPEMMFPLKSSSSAVTRECRT